jgi:integration host factor subunit beta
MQLSKSDLISQIANRVDGLTKTQIENVLTAYCDVASEHLYDEVAVPIPGIGKLTLHHRPSRQARNPRTGEQVMSQEKYVPKFKPAKGLEDWLNS